MATTLIAALPPSLGCPFSSKDAYTTNFKASLSCPISRPAPPPSLKVSSPSESFDYPPPLLSLLPHPLESSPVASTSHVAYTTNRLPAIDEASIELHNALHAFAPSGVDYAAKEYGEAFNWGELRLGREVEREWYIVAFRSKRAQVGEGEVIDLYSADREAHEEAVLSGGLLAYWFGHPTPEGSNLATCIWTSRAAAVRASSGEYHRMAMKLAGSYYEEYTLDRWVLRKEKGEVGVSVRRWVEGEVQGAVNIQATE